MQLRLQTTVEGLSIMAISYYAVSPLLYASKALHAVGLPVNAEMPPTADSTGAVGRPAHYAEHSAKAASLTAQRAG